MPQVQCNRSRSASNPQPLDVRAPSLLQCNRSRSASNPQLAESMHLLGTSVTDPDLRAIRNSAGRSSTSGRSVTDPDLRAIRNRKRFTRPMRRTARGDSGIWSLAIGRPFQGRGGIMLHCSGGGASLCRRLLYCRLSACCSRAAGRARPTSRGNDLGGARAQESVALLDGLGWLGASVTPGFAFVSPGAIGAAPASRAVEWSLARVGTGVRLLTGAVWKRVWPRGVGRWW